jgi:Inositol polyphosphate kinase
MRKFPQLTKVGFRYAGMILHNKADTNGNGSNSSSTNSSDAALTAAAAVVPQFRTTKVDKQWGYQLSAEDSSQGFAKFFYDEAAGTLRHAPLVEMCKFADEMRTWFATQSIITCISSSLLIVYTPEDLAAGQAQGLQAKLIDFAHSTLKEVRQQSFMISVFSSTINNRDVHVLNCRSTAMRGCTVCDTHGCSM